MKRNYEEVEKRDYLTEIIIPIFLGIGFICTIYYFAKSACMEENEILNKQNKTYEQILEYEYNRTFESFEEYIVYRANKILGE